MRKMADNFVAVRRAELRPVSLKGGTKLQIVTDDGYCREYQQVVTVGGKQREAYGTACQQPDGSYQTRAVNSWPAEPLKKELEAFAHAIRTGEPPAVTGEDARPTIGPPLAANSSHSGTAGRAGCCAARRRGAAPD